MPGMMDMGMGYMVVGFIVSLFGTAVFLWGKNLGNGAVKALGIFLTLLPMLTTDPWVMGLSATGVVYLAVRLR